MKYAVYVEGQSELYFVAHILQQYSYYDGQKCGFQCISLNADDYNRLMSPKQGDKNSDNYYQIVNVNNDTRVISKINNDIHGLMAKGFNVVIGLKDVFGAAYSTLANGNSAVDRKLIETLHQKQANNIQAQNCDCRLHFAIMEFEAWMLALIENYVMKKGQTLDELSNSLQFDLRSDIEQLVYHPSNLVKQIYKACGDSYDKHQNETHAFLSTVTVDDYENLRHSGRCASFAKFLDSLLGSPCPQLP